MVQAEWSYVTFKHIKVNNKILRGEVYTIM